MTGAFLGGCVAGLAVAVPVGAVATFIILLSARHGWRVGAAAGLGAATADGVYAVVAVLAGGVVAPLVEQAGPALRWASAVLLAGIGATMVWRGLRTGPVASSGPQDTTSPLRAYLTVLGITAVNPVTVVYFAALVVGSPFGEIASVPARVAFVTGAFAASAVWQIAFATGGSALGRVVASPRGRRGTTVLGGAIVLALAVRTVLF
ncbi:LysE family transporter [Propionicicella superfundia]|uniref:LysE family transporter n=1 Tax=Propionicicella superfundia TaxID=348582 RepID=UPI0003F9F338|nr:LysE family transporter [Propionicicella superfundia]